MSFSEIAAGVAQEFQEKPHDYVAKYDLRIELVNRLRDHLSAVGSPRATVPGQGFDGTSVAYKEEVLDKREQALREKGFDRVHTNVKIDDLKHFDVAVFEETFDGPVGLRSNGSLQFRGEDVAAVFQIEYIINKSYFPTDAPIRSDRLQELRGKRLRSELDLEENNNGPDLDALSRLPDDVETHYLLISNNNYLFDEPLTPAEKREETKVRVGKAAREALRERAGDTTVHYAHPNGYSRMTES